MAAEVIGFETLAIRNRVEGSTGIACSTSRNPNPRVHQHDGQRPAEAGS